MARVKFDDLDKYNSSTGGGNSIPNWLALADDGDTAQVRFLLEEQDDLNDFILTTHKIKYGKNARFPNKNVNCLRDYNDPVSKCPFCEAEIPSAVRVFFPIYNIDADEFEFWERPKGYIGKITKRMMKYKDFPSHIFEIERDGESGDKSTTYNISEVDEDETTLDDLPEVPDVMECGFVFDKTAAEMEYYLDNGQFPSNKKKDDDDEDERPRRRKSRNDDDEEDDIPFDEDADEEEVKPRRRSTGRSVSAKSKGRRNRNAEDEF